MRVTRPAVSVILMRRRVDTSVLAEALRSGMREVVEERDLTGLSDAVKRARAGLRAPLDTVRAAAATDSPTGPAASRSSPPRAGAARPRWPRTSRPRSRPTGASEVCLVDLDLAFGDVAITLQLFPAHTIADAVAARRQPRLHRARAAADAAPPGLTTLVAPVAARTPRTRSRPSLVSRILDAPQAELRLRRRRHPAGVRRPRARSVRPERRAARWWPLSTSRR